ncbi:MAG: Mu-like prophage major head subunit gpT family protein [Candidatus Neomarinimicrobiota bacterium]
MPFPHYQISGDAQRALEEFSTEFDAALAAEEAVPWSRMFGVAHTGLFRATFPIPVSSAGYVARKGDDRYRTLFERSLTMIPEEFHDGVEAKALEVEAPDFIGWGGEPARIARETRRFANVLTAAMLEANGRLSFYADRDLGTASAYNLFDDTHPGNVFDDSVAAFDNLHTAAAINAAMMKAAFIRFATRPAPNGKPMGLTPTHMIVPSALAQEAKDFLESDNIQTALTQGANATTPAGYTNNRWKNIVELVVAKELTNATYVYLIDANGPAPWITQVAETPEEIRFDKDSDYYKRTGKIAIGYNLVAGVAGALPHAIERIQITG